MNAVLAWMIIGVLVLAVFTYFVLAPIAWIVQRLASFVEERQDRLTHSLHTSTLLAEPSTRVEGGFGLAQESRDPIPCGPIFNTNGVDVSFGVWGASIVAYSTELAQLMRQFGPMVRSRNEGGICSSAMSIVAELDQMESVIPPPPNAEAAVHWSSMILLLRRACQSAIHGVAVTRSLDTASELLGMAADELTEVARIMNDWTANLG